MGVVRQDHRTAAGVSDGDMVDEEGGALVCLEGVPQPDAYGREAVEEVLRAAAAQLDVMHLRCRVAPQLESDPGTRGGRAVEAAHRDGLRGGAEGAERSRRSGAEGQER